MIFLRPIALFIIRPALIVAAELLHLLFRLLTPFLLAVLRILLALGLMSLNSIVHGPEQFTDRLASEWTRNLLSMGVSREYIDRVYALCRFLAGSMIVLGWVVAALISVAVLRVVFGIFI